MTLVRVGGHQGKWHSKECAFEDKWINPASKRQVRDKGKTTGTKISGIIKAADGKMPVWQKFRNCFCVFKSGHWTESSRIRLGRMSVVLRASGREKDGLVHFYCLANAPKSPVSSIIHSVPLLPCKLPPRPFFSPSKSSLSLSPDFLFCFSLSVLRALEHNCRYIQNDLPIGSQPKLYLWNKVCSIHLPLLCFYLKGLKSVFKALAWTTTDTWAFIRF